MAPTRTRARAAFERFLETYQGKYPKATECLQKDRDALLAFYDFPAEHWVHLRTTDEIDKGVSSSPPLGERGLGFRPLWLPATDKACVCTLGILDDLAFAIS
jgi:Transposase, Mutator family